MNDIQIAVEEFVQLSIHCARASVAASRRASARRAVAGVREGDFRATNPRFSSANLDANLQPVETLVAMAEAKSCRPGQLALAWHLAQPLEIAPIPGTKRAEFVRENIDATSVAISADEVAYLAEVFAPGRITGERYAATVTTCTVRSCLTTIARKVVSRIAAFPRTLAPNRIRPPPVRPSW